MQQVHFLFSYFLGCRKCNQLIGSTCCCASHEPTGCRGNAGDLNKKKDKDVNVSQPSSRWILSCYFYFLFIFFCSGRFGTLFACWRNGPIDGVGGGPFFERARRPSLPWRRSCLAAGEWSNQEPSLLVKRVVLLTELQLGLGCFVIDGTELLTKTAADDEEPKWRTCQAWPSTLRQVTGLFWSWSAWLRWPFLTELTWSPLIDSASIPAANCTGFSELLIERRHLEAILARSVAVDWCRLTV